MPLVESIHVTMSNLLISDCRDLQGPCKEPCQKDSVLESWFVCRHFVGILACEEAPPCEL